MTGISFSLKKSNISCSFLILGQFLDFDSLIRNDSFLRGLDSSWKIRSSLSRFLSCRVVVQSLEIICTSTVSVFWPLHFLITDFSPRTKTTNQETKDELWRDKCCSLYKGPWTANWNFAIIMCECCTCVWSRYTYEDINNKMLWCGDPLSLSGHIVFRSPLWGITSDLKWGLKWGLRLGSE